MCIHYLSELLCLLLIFPLLYYSALNFSSYTVLDYIRKFSCKCGRCFEDILPHTPSFSPLLLLTPPPIPFVSVSFRVRFRLSYHIYRYDFINWCKNLRTPNGRHPASCLLEVNLIHLTWLSSWSHSPFCEGHNLVPYSRSKFHATW